MIYRIAEAAPGGRGVVGIYPDWTGDGTHDRRLLERRQGRDISVMFVRNYSGHFFERITPALLQYGALVDVLCGREPERLRMFFVSLNPEVEVVPISAMHFNTFELLVEARRRAERSCKRQDLFFATAARPDGLKNTELLIRLLGSCRTPLSCVGYGRLPDQDLQRIGANPKLSFRWRGKAALEPEARLAFLEDLARSRCLLVTSRVEGYSRLVGEALGLGVPVVMHAAIQCENWIDLHRGNCRLFTEGTFEHCLQGVLASEWTAKPPTFEDGNALLQLHLEGIFRRRGWPLPVAWRPLRYGALTEDACRKARRADGVAG